VRTVIGLLLSLSLQPDSSLSQQFDAIARQVSGVVGVHVELLQASEVAGLHNDDRFPMQSVYKLPIAMAVLDQVERRTLNIRESVFIAKKDLVPAGVHSPIRDQHPNGGIRMSIQELIRAAIVDSDGTASDVLFHLGGGGGRLTAYLRSIGIRNIGIAATEAEMARDPLVQYRNYATPREAVALLKALEGGRGISPSARTILLQYLTDTQTGPARLKGLLPSGTVVAHKTGTDGTHNGLTRATNDIGLVSLPNGRSLAIAVFVKDSTANVEAREGVIARIARAAWDRWAAHASSGAVR
jgi:beta-lactamase class A